MDKIDEILLLINEIKGKLGILEDGQAGLVDDVAAVKEDVAAVKEDVAGVKEDIAGVKEDVAGVKEDVAGVKEDVAGVKQDVAAIKKQQEVHHKSILRLENTVTSELKILNENLPDALAKREEFDGVAARVQDHGNRIFALEQAMANQ